MEKDVTACSSASLEDGRNILKQSDIKKSSVKTYDKRQDSVGLYFWKGANNTVFFVQSALTVYVG